jgi:hypothetical protein
VAFGLRLGSVNVFGDFGIQNIPVDVKPVCRPLIHLRGHMLGWTYIERCRQRWANPRSALRTLGAQHLAWVGRDSRTQVHRSAGRGKADFLANRWSVLGLVSMVLEDFFPTLNHGLLPMAQPAL